MGSTPPGKGSTSFFMLPLTNIQAADVRAPSCPPPEPLYPEQLWSALTRSAAMQRTPPPELDFACWLPTTAHGRCNLHSSFVNRRPFTAGAIPAPHRPAFPKI